MTTLVTAIYGHGINTPHGGRGRHIHFYNSSLKNISNLDLPIVIYTDKQSVDLVESFVSSYMKNYKIIPQDIEDFEFAEQILDYKKKYLEDISLNDRNHILCYRKPGWVMDAIKNNYFNTEKFVWIDSGLTHHGIIPEKVGGVELFINAPDSVYYPTNPNNIFNPTLGLKLDKALDNGKILSCALALQGGDSLLREIVYSALSVEVPHIGTHIIGGIFGGHKDAFNSFYNVYYKLLKYCVENDILLLEEPLFSCIYTVYPEMFDVRGFTTWYFHSPGERTHMCEEECDSFYKIFTHLLES